MNGTIVRRIVWKEYRQFRGYWIALFALGAVAQVVPAMYVKVDVESLLATSWIIAALFAVGCAGTMYAREHEDGTFDFLRMLPSPGRTVFVGKLLLAFFSTLLLLAALLAVATGVTLANRYELPDLFNLRVHNSLLHVWGVTVVEAIAWGTFFSLLLRRPLQAALIAVAVASLCVDVIVSSVTADHFAQGYSPAAPYRLALALPVLALDIWLAKFWLRGTTIELHWPVKKALDVAVPGTGVTTPADSRSSASAMTRLVWQEFHEGWLMIAALCAVSLVLGMLLPAEHGFRNWSEATLTAFLLCAALMGVCAFRADQYRSQFRYFTDRGVSPTRLWLSRHLVWGTALLSWLLILAAWWLFETDGLHHQRRLDEPRHLDFRLPVMVLFAIQGYAAGQYASIFIRSGILAALAGIVFAIGLRLWCMLMVVLHVPIWWSVAPITAVLLFASWTRAGDWLAENRTWRARARATFVVSLPLTILAIAVPAYRVLEVPIVSSGVAPSRPVVRAPQTLTAGDLYSEAKVLLVGTLEDDVELEDWQGPLSPGAAKVLAENTKTVQRLLDAANAESGQIKDRSPEMRFATRQFFRLLFVSARQSAIDGQLDDAWLRLKAAFALIRCLDERGMFADFEENRALERRVLLQVPKWSAQPGQTTARLEAVARELAEFEKTIGRPQDYVARNFLRLQSALDGDPAKTNVAADNVFNMSPAWLWRIVFWERWRAKRAVNEYTLSNLNDLAVLDELIAGRIAARPWERMTRFRARVFPPERLAAFESQLPTFEQYISQCNPTTPVLRDSLTKLTIDYLQAAERVESTPLVVNYYWLAGFYGNTHLDAVVNYRALQLLLALAAWKLDHGSLPETLEQLMGPNLPLLPVDPYSGKPFNYRREPIEFTVPERLVADSEALPEGERLVRVPTRAFIWLTPGECSDPPDQTGNADESLQRQILRSHWFELPESE